MKPAKIILTLAAVLICHSALSADIPAAERQALIDLYNSTGGDSWTNNTGWKTAPLAADGFALPGTENTWFGVTTNGENSTVVEINLNDNNLTGTIPLNISDLSNLSTLNLYYNHLSGSIPVEIGTLGNLRSLSLDDNELSGSIPMEFGNLSNLEYVYLGGNQLSGSIPPEIGNLSGLRHFGAIENQLTGTIPAEFGNLSNLRTFYLCYNRLTGEIPAELGNLSNLLLLDLRYNQLTGGIPQELGNLSNLGNLSLGHNQLTGEIPEEIGNLTKLTNLWLNGNQLTGSIPAELGNLGNLKYLASNGNQLTGNIPAELGNLTKLLALHLSGNQLTGAIPTSLTNLTLLKSTSTFIDYNALSTSNAALITFLNSKDPTWISTQTVAPTGISAAASGSALVTVSWTPIVYTGDTGGYRVYYATTSGGPYTFYDQTADKTVTSMEVSGLTAGLPYYFVVRTRTDAHTENVYESKNNPNIVDSEESAEVTATPFFATHIPAAERAALIALYNGTNGDSWTNNTGWKTAPLHTDGFAMPGTENTWFGVYSNDGSMMVTAINLDTNNLVGTLPAGLGELSNLHNLNLSHNLITGNIPTQLGNLSLLEVLTLWENQLTGNIPTSLDNLTALVDLNLAGNQLTGNIPTSLGNLTHLRYLRLSTNQLSGSIPPEIGNLTNLTGLSLAQNRLSGSIPATLGNLTNLEGINLGTNQLTGGIPSSLGNLNNLTTLALWHNQLTGSIPPELAVLSNLQELLLNNNQLTGSIPKELGSMNNLVSLYLQSNQLTGSIPAELGGLTNVIELCLHNNQLSGSIPTQLGNLSNLQYLYLAGNQLSGSLPSSLGNLSDLVELYLRGNQLTGSIPSALGNLTNLTYFDLHNNKLTGSIPAQLGNLNKLQDVLIGRNALTGSIPSSFGNLSALTYLALNANQLTGNIPAWLGNLTNLTNLYLDTNKLSGGIPAELGNLDSLEQLWLDSNLLTGEIPEELGNLTKLTNLWLNENQLTGSIPSSLGKLTKLVYLYLYSNQLSGSIPTELGNIGGTLKVLSLYSNQITGSIPSNLGKLNGLLELSLGDNRLTGSIPAEIGNLGGLTHLLLFSNNLSGSIPTSLTRFIYLDPLHTDIAYNALYSSDATLTTFLNSKDADWAATQTVAPTGVKVIAGNASATLSWTPVAYTGDTGGYRIFLGTTSGGPYTFYAQTADKTVSSQVISGLTPGTPYYFVVLTRTNVHTGNVEITKNNDNIVESGYSAEVTAAPPLAGLTLTSPNGGESWQNGSVHNITWTTTGTVANVKLEYSTNSGTAWTIIVATTANSGTYSWTLPIVVSANCLIRVSEASTGTPTDVSNAVFAITAGIPAIGLSRKSFNFGTEANGTPTPAEIAVITNTGTGTLNWTAAPSAAWLGITPGSGTGAGALTIRIADTNLAVGTYQGTITVSDPNATNSPQTITINLNVKKAGTDSPPFGNFATPTDGATVASSVPVTGWVLDDIGMKSVKIYRGTGVSDRIYIGDAMLVEGARPDVKNAYPTYPQNSKAGWGYMLLTNFLPNGGNGTFTLLAFAKDTGDHEVLLGSKTITCDNLHAVKPFGAIDTPAQGGAASGAAFVNFGWALTPQPNSIPTNGSTIWVYVDGVALGHPVYNNYRKDIATLFPGYANSNAAIGYYYLNTTGYADGVHTIAWSVSDSGGNTDGIGSRYFSIQNAVGGSSAEATAETGGSDPFKNSEIRSTAEILSIPEDGRSPVFLKRGWRDNPGIEPVFPEADGSIRLTVPEVSRIAVYMKSEDAAETATDQAIRGRRIQSQSKTLTGTSRYTAYQLVADELHSLPIGASFDTRDGVLFWQPGPGFAGEYQFVIIDTITMTRKTIKISI